MDARDAQMPQNRLSLAEGFDTPDLATWRALIEKTLKGRSFEDALMSQTADGITVSPLYTRDDLPAKTDLSGFPGFYPFIRGARADGRGWQIRQRHDHPDPTFANKTILRDLERGADAITLAVDPEARQGVAIGSLDDLDRTLEDFDLSLAPLYLEARRFGPVIAALLMALWDRRGLDANAVSGGFGIDPLAALATDGVLLSSLAKALTEAGAIAAQCHDRFPGVTALQVSTRAIHGAGATVMQELATALATGVAYLRACEAAGMTVDEACGQISFSLMADQDVFLTLSKLRAMRLLWGRVMEACGAAGAAMTIHADTAFRMLSRRDPYVNILRTTAAAFAAGLGGADAVTVLPFTSALGGADRAARRIARNIQVILQEESNLGRVIDPAGGSYLVESLTRQQAEKAWALFQSIEGKGGIVPALLSGELAGMLADSRAERDRRLATRQDVLTGVSEFPNRDEKALDVADVSAKDRAALAARTGGTVDGLMADSDHAFMEPLPVYRLAGAFEELRDRADHYAQRPHIFIANLGSLAEHMARSSWVANFYAVGGFVAEAGAGGVACAVIADAFKKSAAKEAVICGPDALYKDYAGPLAQALKKAGAQMVMLAGRPGEQADEWKQAGVDDFIYEGCDVLAVLRDAHRRHAADMGGTR